MPPPKRNRPDGYFQAAPKQPTATDDNAAARQSQERMRRTPFCPGCGLHLAVNAAHRVDCTATPLTRIRLILGGRVIEGSHDRVR
jgi:hypothetical protein